MKAGRVFLSLVALIALLSALAFSPGVQTWAVRRAMAHGSEVRGNVERVTATLTKIDFDHLRLERSGVRLNLPSVRVEAPIFPIALHRLAIRRLVAKGWILDFTDSEISPIISTLGPRHATIFPLAEIGLGEVSPAPSAIPASQISKKIFEGIFAMLSLPMDLQIDAVELEGDVLFPVKIGEPAGRAHVVITGGGVGTGKTGKFAIHSSISLSAKSGVHSEIIVESSLQAQMASARTFNRIYLSNDLDNPGSSFFPGALMRAAFAAEKTSQAEVYGFSLASVGQKEKEILHVEGQFNPASRTFSGDWRVDAGEGELAALTAKFAIPSFSGKSTGHFESDAAAGQSHASGKFDVTTENLGSIHEGLTSLGAVDLTGEFALFQTARVIRIDRLSATLGHGKPVASIDALQATQLDLISGEFKASDSTKDLIRVRLLGLPFSWINPFLSGISVGGDDIQGEFVARTRGEILSVRSVNPVNLSRLTVSQENKILLAPVDISAGVAAEYHPRVGWEANVFEINIQTAGQSLLMGTAKCGRLFASDQPFKATSQFELALPIAAAEPLFAKYPRLSGGKLEGDISAVVTSNDRKFAAKFNLTDLSVPGVAAPLPSISLNARVDFESEGVIQIQAPMVIQSGARRSDIQTAAVLRPQAAGYTLQGQLTGEQLYLEDLKVFAAALFENESGTAPRRNQKTNTKATGPALSGQVHLDFKKLVYSEEVQVAEVVGELHVAPDSWLCDRLQAQLTDGSVATASGELAFHPNEKLAYSASGELNLKKVNPGPILAMLSPQHEPTVEGEFDLVGKVSSEAAHASDLAAAANLDLKLMSRGGKFHGFAASARGADLSKYQKAVSTVGALLEAAAGMVGAPVANTGEKIRAASDVLGRFIEIKFDQLNLEITHEPGSEIHIADFSMISPEVRFVGTGDIDAGTKTSWLNRPLHLDLQIAVRGKQATDMKILGVLKDQKDDLGYIPLSEKIPVEGSISSLGTNALSKLLMRVLAKP